MSGTALFVVVLLCAIGGYVIVALLFDSKRGSTGRPSFSARPDTVFDPEPIAQSADSVYEARRVLGVGANITADELKVQYHALLAKYHPDKTQHLGEEFQRLAEEKTQQIVRAYELLKSEI